MRRENGRDDNSVRNLAAETVRVEEVLAEGGHHRVLLGGRHAIASFETGLDISLFLTYPQCQGREGWSKIVGSIDWG